MIQLPRQPHLSFFFDFTPAFEQLSDHTTDDRSQPIWGGITLLFLLYLDHLSIVSIFLFLSHLVFAIGLNPHFLFCSLLYLGSFVLLCPFGPEWWCWHFSAATISPLWECCCCPTFYSSLSFIHNHAVLSAGSLCEDILSRDHCNRWHCIGIFRVLTRAVCSVDFLASYFPDLNSLLLFFHLVTIGICVSIFNSFFKFKEVFVWWPLFFPPRGDVPLSVPAPRPYQWSICNMYSRPLIWHIVKCCLLLHYHLCDLTHFVF